MAMLAFKQHEQNWAATGEEAGRLCSHNFFECELGIIGHDATVRFPVQVCTKVGEVRSVLAMKLGYIEPDSFNFIVKQGCTYRKMQDCEQVLHKMWLKGKNITSFSPMRHEYPHPYGIIGAGYNGIKTAIFLERYNQRNYVIFDRYDRVGGHCWLECANTTTRLQTEFPTYHVWYGPEFSMPGIKECGGAPVDWEIWPTRDRLLEHFQICADEYGILANTHFSTDVESVELVGKPNDPERYYNLVCAPKYKPRALVQGGGALGHQLGAKKKAEEFIPVEGREPWVQPVSTLAFWPGVLINPREVTYKGEDAFGGQIDYAVEMRFNYDYVTGSNVVIHGHGAFTMENIRTCLEYGVKHIYVVCRKMNLTCPRMVSWFINQSNPPITAAQTLDMLRVTYKYLDYDPWNMHSVTANKTHTHASVNQKTRFGIGDVYFLSAAYGLMEIVVDNIKRCTHRTVHLETGRKLEDLDCILKCTGLLPDWTVDRVLRLKYMKGFWPNGDYRKFLCADPDGIHASNFSITTGGPGNYGNAKLLKHFWDCPNDWRRLEDEGLLQMVPESRAGEPEPDLPAYFIDARHANATGMTIVSSCPLLQEKQFGDSEYKHYIQHLCAPLDKILHEAKIDWLRYENSFREKGMVPQNAPFVPYPFDKEYMMEQDQVHKAAIEAGQGMGGGIKRG